MWVDWTHDTQYGPGDAASDTLTIDATLNLFNAGIQTGLQGLWGSTYSGNVLASTTAAFIPYLIVQNTDSASITVATRNYDAWLWTMDIVVEDTGTSSTLTVAFTDDGTTLTDYNAADYTIPAVVDAVENFTIVVPSTA